MQSGIEEGSLSETKWTPGPWNVQDAFIAIALEVRDAAQGNLVAAMAMYPEADADAHLIAAAPDLYNAALELREAVAACFRTIATIPGLADRLELELIEAGVKEGFGKRAGEALDKARGESQ